MAVPLVSENPLLCKFWGRCGVAWWMSASYLSGEGIPFFALEASSQSHRPHHVGMANGRGKVTVGHEKACDSQMQCVWELELWSL